MNNPARRGTPVCVPRVNTWVRPYHTALPPITAGEQGHRSSSASSLAGWWLKPGWPRVPRLLCVLLLTLLSACGGPKPLATEGAPAPSFELATFEGRELALSDLRGKVVVLNFWATWCQPCRTEMPAFESAYQQYRTQGVEFVGVDLSTDPEESRAFLSDLGITYPNGADTENQITKQYQVTGLPTTVVIGRDGKVERIWPGQISEEQLASLLQDLAV